MMQKIGITAVIGAAATGKLQGCSHPCIFLLELFVDIFELS
jgi:hypothetical protein